jgi:hypothetical protein
MRKKMLMLVTAILPLFLKAQVTVNVQLPPAGMIQRDQLWNLVIVNNTTDFQDAAVSLDLQDAVTGQTVLSGGTRNFTLGKGVKVIGFKDIQPVQYNYISAELSTNYIPLGSYVACYRLSKSGRKGAEPLADECIRLNIGPLSPPLLNTPADKSVLPVMPLQFSWMPPTPAEMFSNLNYDITVAEILQGQSPAEAILNNVPVYANRSIRNPFENYPSSFSSLQPGKAYAWQVTARNGLNYSVQTETWSFSIKGKDSAKTADIAASYVVLKDKQESSGISYINGGGLFVKYYSFDKDHENIIRFLTEDGKIVREVKRKIVYGNNFLRFDLPNEFKRGAVYILEITDHQNKTFNTRFSIQ